MTIYQELQLSSVGSKQLIRATEDKKEKRRHILIYNFKVYLVMAFCVAVVSLYSSLTGKDNSPVSCACTATGRFWNTDYTWSWIDPGNLYDPDDRTEDQQSGFSGSCIFY